MIASTPATAEPRLRDRLASQNELEARAAKLLRTEQPLAPSRARMARVRAAVFAPAVPRAPWAARWLPSPLAAAAAFAVLIAAAFAARTIHESRPAVAPEITTPRHSATPDLQPKNIAASTTALATPQPTPVVAAAAAMAPPQIAAPPRAPNNSAHSIPRAASLPQTPAVQIAPAATPISEQSATPQALIAPVQPAREDDEGGAQLMLEAYRALNHDKDPARTGRLVERYLEDHPNGKLAEEALFLAFKAAEMRADDTEGALAARYLARFPAGRFHEQAERLARSAAGQ